MDVVLYKDIIVADNFITDEENNVLVSLIDKKYVTILKTIGNICKAMKELFRLNY